MPIHLFVYGTLRAGSSHPLAWRLKAAAKLIGAGRAAGILYDFGAYPGAAFAPHCKTCVVGEVFAVNSGDRLIAELDAYEGTGEDDADAMYGRVEVEVALASGGTVKALTYALKRVPARARAIHSGDWMAHLRARRPHRAKP